MDRRCTRLDVRAFTRARRRPFTLFILFRLVRFLPLFVSTAPHTRTPQPLGWHGRRWTMKTASPPPQAPRSSWSRLQDAEHVGAVRTRCQAPLAWRTASTQGIQRSAGHERWPKKGAQRCIQIISNVRVCDMCSTSYIRPGEPMRHSCRRRDESTPEGASSTPPGPQSGA